MTSSFAKRLGFFIAFLEFFAVSGSHGANPYPVDIATIELGHGTLFTDSEGFALYKFDGDLREPGKSTCVGDCAEKYPPLLASTAAKEIPDNWSLVGRDDGTQQWAIEGSPVDRYIRDSNKGLPFGAGNGWNVLFEPLVTPPEMSVSSTIIGHALATSNGLTLYVQEDGPDSKVCSEKCLEPWQPSQAPWGALNYGDFSIRAKNDGVHQWTYKNMPLYQYMGDAELGDINGQGLSGVWKALILEPAPRIPPWVTIAHSDGGALFADSDGKTLHMMIEDKNSLPTSIQGGNHCSEECLDKYWIPVSAESKVLPTGYWSVVEHDNKGLQWAHKGHLLYTLKTTPGEGQELYYTTYRQFQWMKPIMYALPTLRGVF